tara:strand:- start:53 stop:154 length:102 start_codon:yes stop_codon:yes gene_type:complete
MKILNPTVEAKPFIPSIKLNAFKNNKIQRIENM